jgi:non-specific serine/threonine protein kinase
LDQEEKVLFARLSVFQGGRTIEMAEAVFSLGLSIPVMDGIESLLNKSLLYQDKRRQGESRFIMLETIHEYAREKLVESGEARDLQRRHAVYFARLAEQAEKELAGTKQSFWFDCLGSEHDNLRTALAFAMQSDENEISLRIVGALRDFWFYSGHVGEGLGWIERALDSAEEISPALKAKALNAAGWLSFIQGNYESGKRFNGEALALYRELGAQDNIAWALTFLSSHCTASQSEIKQGFALIEEALALFRALGDNAGIIRALNALGELERLDNDYARAEKAYEECLSHCRQSGNKMREAFALANLGLVAQRQGNYDQAKSNIIKALKLLIDLNTKYPLALDFIILSGPIAAQGNPERAACLLGASDILLKAMGLGLQPADQPEIDRFEADVREQLGEEAFQFAWEKGQAMSLEQAIDFALEE